MKTSVKVLLSACLLASSHQALAQKCMTVEEATKALTPFYDFLSHKATPEEALAIFSETYSGYVGFGSGEVYTKKQTIDFLNNELVKPVKNLKWDMKQVIVGHDCQVTVIGDGSGSPDTKDFLGFEVQPGKSFNIMNIDVFKFDEKGMVTESYAVENWNLARMQLVDNES